MPLLGRSRRIPLPCCYAHLPNDPLGLLSTVLSRAKGTLATTDSTKDTTLQRRDHTKKVHEVLERIQDGVQQKQQQRNSPSTEDNDEEKQGNAFVDATILNRVTETLVEASPVLPESDTAADAAADDTSTKVGKVPYNSHPAISATALAHMLWKFVLHTDEDIVVDATAGNGHDTLALARMLFTTTTTTQANTTQANTTTAAHLYALDISPAACAATRERLQAASVFNNTITSNNIHILCQSHAPLPVFDRPVGLIVYNLGYLPGHERSRTNSTTTDTTLVSLASAQPQVRVGGMVSVTVYPRSHPEEAEAVRKALWEWTQTTWRVQEHAPLGREGSPIVYTAVRYK